MRKLSRILAVLTLSGTALGLSQAAQAGDRLTLIVSGGGDYHALPYVHWKYSPYLLRHDRHYKHDKHHYRHHSHHYRGHGGHQHKRHGHTGHKYRHGRKSHGYSDRQHARGKHSGHGKGRRF